MSQPCMSTGGDQRLGGGNAPSSSQTDGQSNPPTEGDRGGNHTHAPGTMAVPSPEELRAIAARQDAKAAEIKAARLRQAAAAAEKSQGADPAAAGPDAARDSAAKLIQKNYRGYRARRALRGYELDSSTRWMEVLREARYHSSTQPMSRSDWITKTPTSDGRVKDRWRRIGAIAHRAGSDDTSSSEVEVGEEEERREARERRRREKAEREKNSKVMGLEYFLEMVDHKHRYGSNLRRYHVEWKKADTKENFFYWLDYGEGKELDLEDRPRKRLDTEQVRYLSREERQRYLVNIDANGLFVWAKNRQPIMTSPDFKDSINGIVPADDSTPTWREVTTGQAAEPSPPGSWSDADSLSGISTGSVEDTSKYANTELHDAKGVGKLKHVSVETVMNHMLRKTTKKNTWIFVADTSFRLYVGIKQSGAFQHSSFLRGARVSAAGLIKIKRGQLRTLSPLSGHYAPPLKNFREFVKSLKTAGADLSHLNTSRSYAVLLGLEGYLGAKKQYKHAEQGVKEIVNPEKKREREEREKDGSQSAQRERDHLLAQERERRKRSLTHKLMRRLGLTDREEANEEKKKKSKSGVDGVGGDGSGEDESPPAADEQTSKQTAGS